MDPRIELCEDGSAEHRRALQQLEASGVSVPASWRPCEGEGSTNRERRLWLSFAGYFIPLGVLLLVSRSRRVPWARIARVEHLGNPYYAQHAAKVAQLLRRGTLAVGRVMRLEVRLLHRERSVRDSLSKALQHEGASTVTAPRMYRHTHIIEVTASAAQMFAQLPSVARRRIRQPTNHGLLTRTNAASLADIPRLLSLLDSAFSRTGGHPQMSAWENDLSRAVCNPEFHPLVTLEHADRPRPERIVSFALGAHNGDHITYQHGASERGGGLGGLPLGYAPIWALAEYGISRGVRYIDLGGISASSDPSHPLHGITAFKRNFGGQDAEIADELSLTLNATNVRLEKHVGKWLNR